MKFRKINDNTINCIITQDDLRKHGINLDDLFDRKKNAVEFIKAIILKAARSVNLNIKNEYTSMRLSVLPDQSVSLTISQDPSESEKIHKEKSKAFASAKGGRNNADSGKDSVAREKTDSVSSGTYLFRFSSIMEMAGCCHMLAVIPGIESSVYYNKDTGDYYLILEKGEEADDGYDSAVLRVNEFGQMVTCDAGTLAFLKEHSDCVVRRGAVRKISELYQ